MEYVLAGWVCPCQTIINHADKRLQSVAGIFQKRTRENGRRGSGFPHPQTALRCACTGVISVVQEWRKRVGKTANLQTRWGKQKRKFHSGISMTTMLLPLLFRFYICGI
ncbi:hypothetical protein [Agathobaculum sp. Marseille-P7918]|uniref:hypothetical protein n=1 Tax=Agathobaculum sp. Marseille-P7918 TaxID=2479843 RepID=UPI000F6431C5|nr:hypothetical protein [Agathobaculum sp. Marseille-P7918]